MSPLTVNLHNGPFLECHRYRSPKAVAFGKAAVNTPP
jgi:hypothetical protein